ncbi:uncharacterized protein LOC131171183 [Hevea brasiliensis]|uniref:uncharacterized protein LOC131171183 n=1 Tax=Hevea brasiliensis TaxID=3981 RepID=UPI0025E74624|nr:uncharacterized protein LOC131171183 [Hevea brasiliensis]
MEASFTTTKLVESKEEWDLTATNFFQEVPLEEEIDFDEARIHELYSSPSIDEVALSLFMKEDKEFTFALTSIEEFDHAEQDEALKERFKEKIRREPSLVASPVALYSAVYFPQVFMTRRILNSLIGLRDLSNGWQYLNSDSRLLNKRCDLQQVELSVMYIPKLKFSYEINTKKIMKELGLTKIFENSREITEIVDSPELYVSDAIHKSYIEVNEEGTIATAVTVFGCACGTALPMFPPPSLDADHPC